MKITIQLSQLAHTAPTTSSLFRKFLNILQGIPTTVTTTYSVVDLYVYPTNEELAVIEAYNLADYVLEEQPQVELINEYVALFNSAPNDTKRLFYKEMIHYWKQNPIEIKIIHLIEHKPVRRLLHNRRESADFVEHLKIKLLPQFKQVIEHYGSINSASSETFEL